MTMTIDTPGIRARYRERAGRQRLGGVDLWVVLDGIDRRTAHEAVAAVVAALVTDPETSTHTAPTTGGTYLCLETGADWPDLVDSIAAGLVSRGLTGTITVPPTSTRAELLSRRFAPAAVLGFTLDPPIDQGPFTAMKRPQIRWGVGPGGQAALLHEARSWALGGPIAWAGRVLHVPLTREDCSDVLHHLLGVRQRMAVHGLAADPPPGEPARELLRRVIGFDTFGESAWSNADSDIGVEQALDDLVSLITRLAPHLDYAVVGAARPAADEFDALLTGKFRLIRHRWDTYVPDAAYAQLLTDRHLERVGDLSAWHVQEVAPGRHLVQWPRWQDWFTEPTDTGHIDPDPDVLAQARHDFADLIATKEVVKANPLRPPT